MEWLAEYGMFLAKAVTFVVALLLVVAMVSALKERKGRAVGTLSVTRLNDQLDRMTDKLSESILGKAALKVRHKERKAELKARGKSTDTPKRVYVLNFHGDIKASALENLRHEVTAILEVATAKDEVVVKLESRRQWRLHDGLYRQQGTGCALCHAWLYWCGRADPQLQQGVEEARRGL